MAPCPHMSTCPLYPLLKTASTLHVWQEKYCEADYTKCARFQRAMQGKMSPMNLLPNGQMLPIGSSGGHAP